MPGQLITVGADRVARPCVRATNAQTAAADPRLSIRVDGHVAEVGVGVRRRVESAVRIHRAGAAQGDGIRCGDAARNVELTACARQGRCRNSRRRRVELLRDRAPRHVGVGRAHIGAERDRERNGENDLDLLLMRAVGVVDRLAQPAGECIGTRETTGAGAGADGQAPGARALRGEEVVGRGDDGGRLRVVAADPDLHRRIERGLVSELLQLVALPLHRAGQQDQGRGPHERHDPDGDDHHHLARLPSRAHQYSSLSTDCESNVITLGMPSSVFRTGFHWSFRSTTTSWCLCPMAPSKP